jgi:hypothetical protein
MNKTKSVRTPPAPARRRSTTAGATPVTGKAASAAPKKVKSIASAPSTPGPKVKHKLVRDSFTIPKSEYSVLEGLKVRAANLKRPVKKSELLRAGVSALHAMTDKAFLSALNAVPSLKTGRPKAAEPSQAPKGSGAG